MTHDANSSTVIRKANVRLLQDNREMQVQFQQTSHVASSNMSLIKTYVTPTTSTSNDRLSNLVLAITSILFFSRRTIKGNKTGNIRSTCTVTKQARPVVTGALTGKLSLQINHVKDILLSFSPPYQSYKQRNIPLYSSTFTLNIKKASKFIEYKMSFT